MVSTVDNSTANSIGGRRCWIQSKMILLLFLLITFSICYLWKRRNLLSLANKIKGLNGYPIIGSAYKFLDANNIMNVINEFHRDFGGPSKFWMGNRLMVYVDDPKHFEIILNSPESLDKGDSYNFIAESIGYGLITLKSDEWRFHRKNLNPSFKYNVITSFYPIFNKNLKVLVENLSKHVGAPFNLKENLERCAMDMICETTLGLDIQTQKDNDPKFLRTTHNLLSITAQRFFQPWIQPSALFWLSKYYRTFHDSVNHLNAVLEQLYTSKKQAFTKSQKKVDSNIDENNNIESDNNSEKTIFIDRIMKLSLEDKIFTHANVLDELKTVLFAGFETTATAATSICALLAIYPDVQEKVFEEIRSVLPDQNMDVNAEDLKDMPYVDAFIKETLRLFPVVPFLTRILKKDQRLDDTIIPKGTECVMDLWNMHRNRSNWKFDATKFNPENFLPENAVPRHPYSYIPFSAGPRNCIGIKYGQIALKLFVVYIVRHYRLTTKTRLEDLKFRMTVTLLLTNENMFELHHRTEY